MTKPVSNAHLDSGDPGQASRKKRRAGGVPDPAIDPQAKDGQRMLRPKFWERIPLKKMTTAEWEALCDGCGKCCLNKLEDDETGEVAFTRVACRLLDDETCRCTHYEIRHQFVPDCVTLTPDTIEANAYWMPKTCAYRLLAEGKPLLAWHYLISGRRDSVHAAGVSVQGMTLSEFDIPEDDWEDHLIEIDV